MMADKVQAVDHITDKQRQVSLRQTVPKTWRQQVLLVHGGRAEGYIAHGVIFAQNRPVVSSGSG
jgi:hypothetical protein